MSGPVFHASDRWTRTSVTVVAPKDYNLLCAEGSALKVELVLPRPIVLKLGVVRCLRLATEQALGLGVGWGKV